MLDTYNPLRMNILNNIISEVQCELTSKLRAKLCVILAFCLVMSLSPTAILADSEEENNVNASHVIEVKSSASEERHVISFIDEEPGDRGRYVSVQSSVYFEQVSVPAAHSTNMVAVLVNQNDEVVQVINESNWGTSVIVDIPEGGYALLGKGESYSTETERRFLRDNFHIGDSVQFFLNGEVTTLQQLKETPPTEQPQPPEEEGPLPNPDDQLQIEIQASNGAIRKIDFVDTPPDGHYVAVLTSRYGDRTGNENLYNTAVQVNEHNQVTMVTNKALLWNESPNIAILDNGFTLLAQDSSYALGFRKFLIENFNVGDTIRLLINGEEVTLEQFKQLTNDIAKPSSIVVDQPEMYSVTKDETTTTVSGYLTNYSAENDYSVNVQGQVVQLTDEGQFSHIVQLNEKTNYINVEVLKDGEPIDTRHVIVYRYMREHDEHDVWLWIEQSTNAKNFPNKESIRRMLLKAKDAGVTGVQFPVKGHEGFVTYLKNDLSGTPHISQIQEPSKQGVPEDFDQLQAFIDVSRELDLKIVAVFNVFAGGTVTYTVNQPYQLLSTALTEEQLHEYEEWVYSVDDSGEIKRFKDSNYQNKVIHFLNPANPAVQEYQLKHFEEVMRNYDVDAVVLDRARYDTMHADFSPVSRERFEDFLADRDKTLVNWPADVFEHQYDQAGNYVETVNGPLYYDWLAFRSTMTKQFMEKTRELVDRVNADQNTEIQLAVSLGSWYENYYQSGQNWASPDFVYDERLDFPVDELYTNPEYRYRETAFGDPEIFDYMVIGTYQNNPAAIKKYLTMLNILTMEKFPVYAGMQVPVLPEPADQREAFQAAFTFSNGIKLFDLSRLNWDIQKAAINDYEYVKQYQLGISLPEHMPDFPANFEPVGSFNAHIEKGFIEANDYNQGLSKGSIVVYNEIFGETTGTSGRFTVEAVVGAEGQVSKVVNKQQAINWSWGTSETANSDIPEGGFVIATIDNDGIKTKRQLIAHAYSSGDEVRAAVLQGHLDYDGTTTSASSVTLKGTVEVLGAGIAQVTINGNTAEVDEYGEFAGDVQLELGANHVEIIVHVDGLKTNQVAVQITRIEGTTPEPEQPTNPGPGTGISPPKDINTLIRESITINKDGNGNIQASVDQQKVLDIVKRLTESGQKTITFDVGEVNDSVGLDIAIPADLFRTLHKAWNKDGKITIIRGNVSYELPIHAVDVEAMAKQLNSELGAVEIVITIHPIGESMSQSLDQQLRSNGMTRIGAAFEFQVKAVANGTSADVQFGNVYVERTIKLPLQSNLNLMSALVYDPETDELKFVPAVFSTKNGVTEARIKRNSNSIYTIISYNKTFTDLSDHWAKTSIERLASKFVIKGVSEDRFAPDQPVTRAEFASLLIRSLSVIESSGSSFTDVKAADWHSGYVNTATALNITNGYEDGSFRPQNSITVEQMTTMVVRALEYVTNEDHRSTAVHQSGKQTEGVSSWAQTYLSYANDVGLFEGIENSDLNATAIVTRAEAAVIIENMLSQLKFINSENN